MARPSRFRYVCVLCAGGSAFGLDGLGLGLEVRRVVVITTAPAKPAAPAKSTWRLELDGLLHFHAVPLLEVLGETLGAIVSVDGDDTLRWRAIERFALCADSCGGGLLLS